MSEPISDDAFAFPDASTDGEALLTPAEADAEAAQLANIPAW